jgi:hypothetical protein
MVTTLKRNASKVRGDLMAHVRGDKQKLVSQSINFPPAMMEWLKNDAEKWNRSISQEVVWLIQLGKPKQERINKAMSDEEDEEI